PVSIKNRRNQNRSNLDEPSVFGPSRSSFPRNSPLSSSPREREGPEAIAALRRSTITSLNLPPVASSPPRPPVNPSRPDTCISYEQISLARRWQHIFPTPSFQHQIKWQSMLTPACLPLTTEHFPTQQELGTAFEYFSYDCVVDPPSMSSSFCIRVPADWRNRDPQEAKDLFALAVMRGQTSIRLSQGFQFVVRPRNVPNPRPRAEDRYISRRSRSFASPEDDLLAKFQGASEVLISPFIPVYFSMTSELHRLSYNGEVIKVEIYLRKGILNTRPFNYECLVWPKLGDGYTQVITSFRVPGVEKLSWNSMDMMVAGYMQPFNVSSRFWRTRFLVIPTEEAPAPIHGSNGERLNDEEIRLAGIDKLADLFGKARWILPGEKPEAYPPPRFLPTYLGPAACLLDDTVVAQLEEIHALGPLKKKKNSEKVFQEYSLQSIAKAMREEDGVPIKDYKWHGSVYPDSFTGANVTSWLVREFSDISTREQALQWISTSARCLEELIRQWSRGIEKYGLRLVEGFVDQIVDIRDKNTFQCCFPIRLAVPPPVVKRLPEGEAGTTDCYVESQILKTFGFVVDVEAQDRYSDQIDVFYSYRRSSYKYTQWVHRSGAAFVQVIGGREGFRFLTNRLLGPGRLGTSRNIKGKTLSQIADGIREPLYAFCSDPAKLIEFYDEIKATIPEDDVEPLTI
ncbi:hypothetical protein M422DRAFT_168412, partial [Sphaerobolus stellatus SS14]